VSAKGRALAISRRNYRLHNSDVYYIESERTWENSKIYAIIDAISFIAVWIASILQNNTLVKLVK